MEPSRADDEYVFVSRSMQGAGEFALARYRQRHRAWLRRVWWIFPLLATVPVAAAVGVGWMLHARHMQFLWGAGVGAAAGAILVIAGSPPAHIARWRLGADGERATARAIRPLVNRGWTLINDTPTKWGNIDHVLIGPPGVFVLESKNLNGIVSVERGVLSVRWREDPEDGYQNRDLARRVRAAAADLHEALACQDVSTWVQPVVVLWASFDQRSVLSDGVAWVRGEDLAHVLAKRPTVAALDAIESAIHAACAELAGEHHRGSSITT